jgi:thiol-disulfide isomerase/thioredoxin
MVWSRICTLTLFAALACQQAAGETVLLEFTTQHCGPCRRMRPVVQQLAAEGYAVREVDATSEPQAANQYRVTGFPTFIVVVDGREFARLEGSTDHRTLVEMIHRATAIAAQQQSPPAAARNDAGVTFVNDSAVAANPFAPVPGRVTQLGSEPAANFAAASTGAPNPFAMASTKSFAASPGPTGDAARLIASTVRLSISDAQGQSTGTGTIIDSRMGKALILTCGHLFRESKGQGVVDVTLFRNGPQGAEPAGSAQAQVIDFDLDRDLALVVFEVASDVAVTPLAPRGIPLTVEAPVTSVGCGHGANPTPWESRITAVNRYQGHPNVEAARAPEEGRSGGGLFNAAGQLIGVCFAADPQGNEGLYASLDSIYQKLDALNLTATLQTPPRAATPAAGLAPPASQFAAAPAPFEVRGQSPTPPPLEVGADASNPFAGAAQPVRPSAGSTAAAGEFAASPPAAARAIDPATLPIEERAAIQEIGRRAGNSEVIIIIRPHDATEPSDVIKLKTASPDFVQTLEAAGRSSAAEAGAAMATRPSSALVR